MAPRCSTSRRSSSSWEFLCRHTEVQVIDFWHAAGYLSGAGDALFAGGTGARKPWLEASCHRLKHEEGAARQLIRDLRRTAAEKGISADQEDVAAAITYFSNQSRQGRMDYAGLVKFARADRQRRDGGGVQGAGEASGCAARG